MMEKDKLTTCYTRMVNLLNIITLQKQTKTKQENVFSSKYIFPHHNYLCLPIKCCLNNLLQGVISMIFEYSRWIWLICSTHDGFWKWRRNVIHTTKYPTSLTTVKRHKWKISLWWLGPIRDSHLYDTYAQWIEQQAVFYIARRASYKSLDTIEPFISLDARCEHSLFTLGTHLYLWSFNFFLSLSK